jgi:XTP/dITP diphosphohydrolase
LSRTIYFLTSNKHKIMEVEPIASRYGFEIEGYSGYKIEIQSMDLAEISEKAALIGYMLLKKPVLVEDAGLFIEALNGFPGPYSSYVYKTLGIKGILKLMKNTENRRAYFMSATTIIYKPCIITATGIVYGTLTHEPRGNKGFGFDPIFVPEGSDKTFAEMDIEEKNKYSHRARSVDKAFNQLIKCIS